MSAYLVDLEHINVLVSEGLKYRANKMRWNTRAPLDGVNGEAQSVFDSFGYVYRELNVSTSSIVGQMLVSANQASVNARYPGDGDPLPAPYEYARPEKRFEAVEILKAISGFEYQACEVSGWGQSEAHAFCAALRGRIIDHLPGMDAADTWEITQHTTTLQEVRVQEKHLQAERENMGL